MEIQWAFTYHSQRDQTRSLWRHKVKHSQGKDWIIWVSHHLLSCWDEGASHNCGENLCHVWVFLLSILTVISVLCWPEQCNSLTWSSKGVYFRCEHSFLFWLSASHGVPTRSFLQEQCLPPQDLYSSPASWEGDSSRVSHPALGHCLLSVVHTLLSAFCSSECLAADTIQGRFFPSRIALALLPCNTVELAAHRKGSSSVSTLFTAFSIRAQLFPHSIAFRHINRPWSDLPFCVEKKKLNK